MSITLQETFDAFLLSLQKDETNTPETTQQCERTFQLFSEYLIYYSDLFHAEEAVDEGNPQDWEASLDDFITQLMQGEQDNTPSLEGLSLEVIHGEYLRDFIGWHLLREPSVNSLVVQHCTENLQQWLKFTHQKHWLDDNRYEQHIAILQDTLPDAKRAAIAAHLLLYHIRLGGGISPRLRGTRFDNFKEGHARIAHIHTGELWLSFDNDPKSHIGPILLPETILQQLRAGDVIDIELGQRSETWTIVDIGPVYPAIVYVAAEEMALPEKKI